MKKIKSNLIGALAVAAGAFCCCSNTFFTCLPKNVQINGVEVGRLSRKEALCLVRESIARAIPTLTVTTPCGVYEFSYPQIGFFDDAEEIVKNAKRNGCYECNVSYYLKAEESVVLSLCEACTIPALPATLSFNGSFSYTKECAGRGCEKEKLKADIEKSLAGDFSPVFLSCYEVIPECTVESLKAQTRPLGSFTTTFDGGNIARAHNIALAAKSVNGTVVEAGEEFSFNRVVGARTRERGYREAKIISGGAFVNGVGGGVCQASTTVYNAALVSGMEITRVQAHSLSVGYVEPSFDAMVSSSSDMTFINPFSTPVYIRAKTGENRVTVEFFGKPSGYTYKRVSEVLSVIPPKAELVEEGEEDLIKVPAKNGMKSRGSLLVYRGGELKEKKQLRRDTYASVRGVRVVKREEETPSSEGEQGVEGE